MLRCPPSSTTAARCRSAGRSGSTTPRGTPEQLADHILAWQDAGAVDGFTIMGSTLPRELTAFAEQVVPILQARGRYRTGYAGSTLRDHLGLRRPAGLG
jgi:alkanesulfonate monooxygenase SsuD/methylene tetrahydromethanopterin reductase-like flavin-dependent oxidoreductase (luciferase family)